MIKLVGFVVLASLLVFGCSLFGPQQSATKVSSAFFDVPTSFTGGTPVSAQAKTVLSDAWVKASIQAFYATVRDQVRFGADVARGLKAVLLDLEQIKIGGSYLMDTDTNITHSPPDGRKFRWTTETPGTTYFLEVWAADGTKSLELRFSRDGTHYWGTAVASPTSLGWTEPTPPIKNPDRVKAEFDTNSDSLGTARLAISVQDFRYHPDLDPGLEKAIIILTKDTSDTVKLGSVVRVENSRHFVWNGYIKNTSNQEVLNPSAAAQTRYYVAAGVADPTNHATVHLGIPTSVGTDVFTGNGIGALINQLFADRLNNDYDFDGSTDAGVEHGHEVIALLNTINGGSPSLDETTYNNSAASVLAALTAAKSSLDSQSTPSDMVDYLVSMMGVANPAYFVESSYDSYGATVPAGWPALTDADARALLPAAAQTAVDSMSIAFENNAAPGF